MTAQFKPQHHLWTRPEYYKLAEIGLFEKERVELIKGQVFEMSPMGTLHATAVTLTVNVLEHTLQRILKRESFIRVQMPLSVDKMSEPEPAVAIIHGHIRDYAAAHPSTAQLVVEISETSLEYDRLKKRSLYAKAGIAEYWILNVIERQLEVHRHPVTEHNNPDGVNYADVFTISERGFVNPLLNSEAKIAVADLLP